jgi:hypothetical protein
MIIIYGLGSYFLGYWIGTRKEVRKLNLNKLATKITKAEGLKKSVNIGQVKEVMKLVFREVARMTLDELNQVIKKYKI